MIIKEKNDDNASKCLSAVLRRIRREALHGNSGLIFASTYTLNTRAQNMLRRGLSSLFSAFRGIGSSVVSLWLLPPPIHFSRSNYYYQHVQGIRDLMSMGAFMHFDHAVHAKFLLAWLGNDKKVTRHCRYFGSTNFTLGGLVRNFEEFHYDLNGGFSKLHSYYFEKAVEYLSNIINSYSRREYLNLLRASLNNDLRIATSDINAKIMDAKRAVERLEAARTAYFHAVKVITSLWNFPGKKWAHALTESFLEYFENPLDELEFLEETLGWPSEEIDGFVESWHIESMRYVETATKLGAFLNKIRSEADSYFERGYKAFLFDEEASFIEQLPSKEKQVSKLREIRWAKTQE